MDAIIEVCSRTHEIFTVNPFWIFVSINSLLARKEKIKSRRHEVKTLRGRDSRVIGLKLAGSSLVPFFCTRMGQIFFHSDGTIIATIIIFLNLILTYKLNIQIQISLMIGNLHSADLITGISSIKKINE